MSDLNSYSFTGRLGADAEIRYTGGGSAVWSARVAIGYGFGDNKGTNWITVKVFGKRAEAMAKFELTKGTLIGACGELRNVEFDRKEGGKGYAIEVIADNVALLSPKEGAGRPQDRSTKTDQRPAPSAGGADAMDDDDIPFRQYQHRVLW